VKKKILFIGINYYAYVGRICHALESAGYEVDYHEIEPVDVLSKAWKKFFPNHYNSRLSRYHDDVIEKSSNTQYDIVLFIQVHHFDFHRMEKLRSIQKKAKFILYNWDSLGTHDYRPWLKFFEKSCTFDPVDAENLDINYLPLFALDEYFTIDQRDSKEFDLYFVGAIGTFHRFRALREMWRYCRGNDLRIFFHLKCSPVMMFRLLVRGHYLPGMTLRSLGFADIVRLIGRSRCVFDFANHRQSGYTMRLIENMCAGLKVVTENPRIRGEEFYRSDRFLVVENLDFTEIRSFIEKPITSRLDTQPFHIESWAARLLS